MLCYITPDWDESDVVVKAVHKLIVIFGPDRCFFASNYPVDVKDNWCAFTPHAPRTPQRAPWAQRGSWRAFRRCLDAAASSRDRPH